MVNWNILGGLKQQSVQEQNLMSNSVKIDLGEVLDISMAASFFSQLKESMPKGSNVVFTSSELTRIDASCLQVLLAFMAYAKESDISVSWEEPSDSLKNSARLLGLTEKLNIAA